MHGSLVTVGDLAEVLDGHGLLLDVVLCEEARLARHHLLDGGRDHQVVDVIVGAPGLPPLGRDNLGRENRMVASMRVCLFGSLGLDLHRMQHWLGQERK